MQTPTPPSQPTHEVAEVRDSMMRPGHRFDWVTTGRKAGNDPVFDRVLVESADAVAVPSIGSLVPGWTLLVPRAASLSLAALAPVHRDGLWALAIQVATVLKARFTMPIYAFEHGPAYHGSIVGCGVDQAHLHLVPLPFDLVGKLAGAQSTDDMSTKVWSNLSGEADYYLARDMETGCTRVAHPDQPTSQMFRKLIAAELGVPAAWDYREMPFRHNAQHTARAFGLEPIG